MLLQYRFPRTTVSLSYIHRTTNGSGFSLAATSDIARLSATRPLSRRWEVMTDIGYARNASIIPATVSGVTASRIRLRVCGRGSDQASGAVLHRFSELPIQ